MSTVLMDQVDTWWGYALGWTVNGYVAVSLVYNNQHYISDIIWGAPVGYFVGKWVSEHRSSKYTYRDGIPTGSPSSERRCASPPSHRSLTTAPVFEACRLSGPSSPVGEPVRRGQ